MAFFVKELYESLSTAAVTILKTLQCCDVMTKKRYFEKMRCFSFETGCRGHIFGIVVQPGPYYVHVYRKYLFYSTTTTVMT